MKLFAPGLPGTLACVAPAYRTYPTHDWFVEAFGAAEVSDWFAASETLEPAHLPSLAVHLPEAGIAAHTAAAWLTAFGRETALYAARLARAGAIGEVHWTLAAQSAPPGWLAALLDVLSCGFNLGAQPRLGVALHPAAAALLPQLLALGFTRIDIGCGAAARADAAGAAATLPHAARAAQPSGVQDADAAAWAPALRGQLLELGRQTGISLALGLHYGAPGQTAAALEGTLDALLACRPGRIQLRYAGGACCGTCADTAAQCDGGTRAALPCARLNWLRQIAARLSEAGYMHAAADYYALPQDPFGIAQRRARLVPRPYGLSAAPGLTTIALGPAAIGAVGPVYYQNQRGGAAYIARLERHELPVMRGLGLSADDMVRRAVIHSLSCNFFVDIEALALAYGIDFDRHFAAEQPALRQLAAAGLIERTPATLEIVGDGLLLVDPICQVFDAHLRRRGASKPHPVLL